MAMAEDNADFLKTLNICKFKKMTFYLFTYSSCYTTAHSQGKQELFKKKKNLRWAVNDGLVFTRYNIFYVKLIC